MILGDRVTPKLMVGGLLAISGVAIKSDRALDQFEPGSRAVPSVGVVTRENADAAKRPAERFSIRIKPELEAGT
ncbi:hypothetical protein Q3C01_22615 [Bradyrhizobium sp. UFLA05-109]